MSSQSAQARPVYPTSISGRITGCHAVIGSGSGSLRGFSSVIAQISAHAFGSVCDLVQVGWFL